MDYRFVEKLFGFSLKFPSENFVEINNPKNPYLIGKWHYGEKVFHVYVGKDGLKIVPYNQDAFVGLVFSVHAIDKDKKVFVDGNQKGFCVIYVWDGKIRELFLFRRSSTSNSNELEALRFALKKFPSLYIFSDSSYAIKKVASDRVRKIKSHSGILWNCIPDYILKNI